MNIDQMRFEKVRERLAKACQAAGRMPAEVRLLAVSKMHPPAAISRLASLGQRCFGENHLQEARQKQQALQRSDLEWHFIGPIQSNKTAEIAAHFDWAQAVDREKILGRLSKHRPDGLDPPNICLQVNIDQEPQKAGLPPEEVCRFADLAARAPLIRLRGLMCIPRLSDNPEETRASFRRMYALYRQLQGAGHSLDTLSMGMSADLELAIAEGSTMIRVGTDLFGPRPTKPEGNQPE